MKIPTVTRLKARLLIISGLLILFGSSVSFAENGIPVHTIDSDKRIVGVSIRTSNAEAATTIPALWNKFMSEQLAQQIPNPASNSVFAVYTDFENEGQSNEGLYTFLIGMQATDDTEIPEGFESVEIQASDYYIFQVENNNPENVFDTWMKIWSTPDLENAFVSDYEEYKSTGEITVSVGTRN